MNSDRYLWGISFETCLQLARMHGLGRISHRHNLLLARVLLSDFFRVSRHVGCGWKVKSRHPKKGSRRDSHITESGLGEVQAVQGHTFWWRTHTPKRRHHLDCKWVEQELSTAVMLYRYTIVVTNVPRNCPTLNAR